MKILPKKTGSDAFTLAELVITTGIALLVVGGSIYGYTVAAQRAEWSAYSLAANSLAMQQVEQCRAAKWDPLGDPSMGALLDELGTTNYTVVDILDIPISGTNVVYATSVVTVATVSASPPLRKIRVDCFWPFMNRGTFSNTVMTYRAVDQ